MAKGRSALSLGFPRCVAASADGRTGRCSTTGLAAAAVDASDDGGDGG